MTCWRFIITILVLAVFHQNASAQYEVSKNCTMAWEALLDLRINTAKELTKKEISLNPDNYYAYYVAQNCDAYELMINATSEGYEAFKDNYYDRRENMDDKDVESPYYLACESEMQLQMGIFNIIFGDRLAGLRRAFSAYKKIYKNLDRYPDFQMGNKLDGMLNVAISNLPPFVSWAANTFGVSGDAEVGYSILNTYFDYFGDTPGLNEEAVLYTILAHKLNKDPLGAYNFIKSIDSSYANYLLLKYFYANVAYQSGFNEEALNIFSTFNPNELEIQFNPYNYLYGKIMLRKLDSSAIMYFTKYLDQNNKKDNLKEINYQLALAYLINGNIARFLEHKKFASELGDDITERDREAMYDYRLDYIPDINLVKAKLLLDGGYNLHAKAILEKYSSEKIDYNSQSPYSLEYNLLIGRLEYQTNNNKLAIISFEKVLDMGKDQDYYFASEAALYLGLIFEKTDPQKAISFFERARELYDSDYYEYIDEISKKRIKILSSS